MQEILVFNQSASQFQTEKTSVRGHGNQHDESKGIDLKIGEEFIKNGIDNFFPFDIEEVSKRSMIQKRAFRTITQIIDGNIIFQNEDGSAVTPQRQKQLLDLYAIVGITKEKFISPCVRSNYLQGGSYNTLQFGSNGRTLSLSSVVNRAYKTVRLSFPMWKNNSNFSDKHFYHRNWGYQYDGKNKKIAVSKSTLSWLDWNKDPKKNFDNPMFIYNYDIERPLSDEINRLQSYLIADFDGLSDYYPTPVWYSGTTYNYQRAEFFLSCFDIDDIENGLHASGIVKVFHESYIDPESGEAKQNFEQQKKIVEQKLKGAYNSGAVLLVPTAIGADGKEVMTNGSMSFEELKTSNTKDRHDVFDTRIINKLLGANGIIIPELIGIRDDKSTLSESGDKLIKAVRLLNQFTIKPQKELLDDPKSGFFNKIINPLLGITEKTVLMPNLKAFMDISESLAMHFLHPDQWYDLMLDFGLSKPTVDQIASGLIPAYTPAALRNQNNRNNGGSMQ